MTQRTNCLLASFLVLWCAHQTTTTAADKKKAPKTREPERPSFIFYPSAPEEPRLQYLTSISKETDLGGGPSKFAKFLVGKEPPKKGITKPYGLAVWQGRVFVCDSAVRGIVILDLAKKSMETASPEGEGRLLAPINLAIDEDGTRYVADTSRGQVVILDSKDSYVGVLARTNMRPSGVALVKERVYVADIGGRAIRVFDKGARKELFSFPNAATGTNELIAPNTIVSDRQGRLYVSEMTMGRVQIFDAEGRLLRMVGELGDRPGEFVRPKGVAVDRENRFYVVDAGTAVVQIFDDQGRLLMFFGEPKSGKGGLYLPAGIAIDYENVGFFEKFASPDFKVEYLVLVSSQFGDRKINVYGFGHKK